ncbi:MAG TPA: tail fiber protein [Chitinophagaceae bacterium]|jgi:microcystin-dependent protein|nr:tail fiber protein [Chitinophagaceae bacterium]
MEGTLAEIRMFAGNFAPRGWMLCQGQLLSIAQWTAVFALVGTTYGGNGQTTFGVPDFRGRMALGTGQGPGQPNVDLGEISGVVNTTLTLANLPMHNHALTGTVTQQANAGTDGTTDDPSGRRLMGSNNFTGATSDLVSMAPMLSTLVIAPNGGNQSFSNRSPYLGIQFIFCVEGIFPSRD